MSVLQPLVRWRSALSSSTSSSTYMGTPPRESTIFSKPVKSTTMYSSMRMLVSFSTVLIVQAAANLTSSGLEELSAPVEKAELKMA